MAAEFGQEKELPSLLPRQKPLSEAKVREGHYGPVPDTLRQGFTSIQNDLSCSHPLEYSERNYLQVQDQRDMIMLRNIQGLHAPLKLQLERSFASQLVNEWIYNNISNWFTHLHASKVIETKKRLPCLPSSMVALETLLGIDTTIDFDDFLNDPNDSEISRDAHSVMEKQ